MYKSKNIQRRVTRTGLKNMCPSILPNLKYPPNLLVKAKSCLHSRQPGQPVPLTWKHFLKRGLPISWLSGSSSTIFSYGSSTPVFALAIFFAFPIQQLESEKPNGETSHKNPRRGTSDLPVQVKRLRLYPFLVWCIPVEYRNREQNLGKSVTGSFLEVVTPTAINVPGSRRAVRIAIHFVTVPSSLAFLAMISWFCKISSCFFNILIWFLAVSCVHSFSRWASKLDNCKSQLNRPQQRYV